MSALRKTVIVIAGPTAVGKTAVAIEVARSLGTEIISADSRQCYREMNIGVARPSPEELQAVPHHFIASHSVLDKVNAAVFESYALNKAAELFRSRDAVVVVGGTGLYIRALTEGMDSIPEVPGSVRQEIVQAYMEKGLSWLQEEVKRQDPIFYGSGEILNPHRLMRALEVRQTTGQSILSFRTGSRAERPFRTLKFVLDLPRESLYDRINRRVDLMMDQGLVEEVRRLLPYQELTALQTVGYKEIFDHLDGRMGLAEAAELVKRNTRHYAKRQLTWFRKDPGYTWLPPEAGQVIKCLNA